MAKRRFKIDISVAIEAENLEEAFALLVSQETSQYIQEVIKASKNKIVGSYDENEGETTLLN